MRLTRQALSRYDTLLAKLEGAAREYAEGRILAYVETFPGATPEQVRDFAIETVDAAATRFGDGASSVAADLYDGMAKASGARVNKAVMDTSDVRRYVEKEVRYQLRKFLSGDHGGFAAACGRSARDQVSRRANQTMRLNASRDGLRYARVPMGGETCTFCAMLASRGFVYRSAKLAGEGNHYHANCRCKVIPGFDGMGVEGYDPDEWLGRWEKMREIDNDKSLTPSQKAEAKSELAGVERQTVNRDAQAYGGLSSGNLDIVERLANAADNDAGRLYLRFEGEFAEAVTKAESGCYKPYENRVYLDQKDAFHGKKEAGDTWFHEFGHNVDFLLGGGRRSFSSQWNVGEFQSTIKQEVVGFVKKRKAELPKLAEELAAKGDVDSLYRYGLIGRDVRYSYVTGGLDADGLKAALKKPTMNLAYKIVGEEISTTMSDEEKHALSDIFGGATGNRAVDGWGHLRNSYWDKAGNALAQEAFAEMFAGSISSPKAMAKLREYLPESCKMFDKMLEEAIAGVQGLE